MTKKVKMLKYTCMKCGDHCEKYYCGTCDNFDASKANIQNEVKMFEDFHKESCDLIPLNLETGSDGPSIAWQHSALAMLDAHALELSELNRRVDALVRFGEAASEIIEKLREEVERLKKLNKCDCGRDMCQCENDE